METSKLFLFCWDNKQAIRNIPSFDVYGIVVPTICILYRDSGLQGMLLRLENTTCKKFLLWIPIKSFIPSFTHKTGLNEKFR